MPQPATTSRRRLLVVSCTVGALLAELIGAAGPAGASPPSAAVGLTSVTATAEYFTSAWGNPLDFSDDADFDVTPRFLTQQGTASLSGGMLQFVGVGQAFFLRADGGSLPLSATRDPRSRPLDAARYSRISFRMHSTANAAAAFGFRQCNEPGCQDGAKYFEIRKGWHTYDLDMTGDDDLETIPPGAPNLAGVPWSNHIEMLYLSPAFNVTEKPTLTFDDFRIYQPTNAIVVSVTGAPAGSELWMDTDNAPWNDGSTEAGISASRLIAVSGSGPVAVPGGTVRAGQTARFYVSSGGVRHAPSSAVSMTAESRPTPRVLSPSELGGTDWSWEVRQDPWDMDQASDVEKTFNIGSSIVNGEFWGWTGSPTPNDPVVILDQSGIAIDATRYHKLAVTIRYDGTWGLEDLPGAGMNARVIWQGLATPEGTGQVSDDLVVLPGRHTYVIDLDTFPKTRDTDPLGTPFPVGWGTGSTSWVSHLRIDPHEDRGSRTFQIEQVQLLRNESVAPTFDIRFVDDTPTAGSVADLYADPDGSASNGPGLLIASGRPVVSGVNHFEWDGGGVPAGSYFIHAYIRGANGAMNDSYSTGRVDVGLGAGATPPRFGAPVTTGAVPTATAGEPTPDQMRMFFLWLSKQCTGRRKVRVGGRVVMQTHIVACPRKRASRRR